MELFLLLQSPVDEGGEAVEFVTGQQLDCRDWQGNVQRA
jgi:hypothetical protein